MNKTEIIVHYLISKIENGIFTEGMKIPSEYELAKQFGINKITANKAVSQLVARGMLERRRGQAGTLVCHPKVPFGKRIVYRMALLSGYTYSSKLLRGAMIAARRRGYSLVYSEIITQENSEQWRECVELGAAGVLGTCCDLAPDGYELPVMYVGNCPNGENLNYCACDNYTGAKQLAEFLLQRDYKKPVILSPTVTLRHLMARYQAYLEVFPELEKRTIHINPTDFNPENIYQELTHNYPDATALICDSDATAFKMIHCLENKNIHVPENILVTGFGYMQEYQELRSITTVDQCPEEVGFCAAMLLIDLIEKVQPPVQRFIPPRLVP
ncbi:MAG: GntR family transcriptional regulator [Lentisphaeria bacterium]